MLEHSPLVQSIDYCYKLKIQGALYNSILECQILVQFFHQFVSHFFSIELGVYASLHYQCQFKFNVFESRFLIKLIKSEIISIDSNF
jgi:hypothetical protein